MKKLQVVYGHALLTTIFTGALAPRAPVVPTPLPIGLMIERCGREEVWEWDTSGMGTGQYWYGNETVVVWEVREVRGSSKELKRGRRYLIV